MKSIFVIYAVLNRKKKCVWDDFVVRVYIFKWYNLLITEFDHLEVTLSGWQDIKIQLLTDYSLTHTHSHV